MKDKKMLHTINKTKILDINYFTYSLQDAEFFLHNLALAHSQNHLYVTKENMRYYIRGYIVYKGYDIKFERYQIAYLAQYCDCIKFNPNNFSNDAYTENDEINYQKAV